MRPRHNFSAKPDLEASCPSGSRRAVRTLPELFLVLAFLSLSLPPAAGADLCDDIAQGADGWAELADAVHEIAERGGATAEESRQLDGAIQEILDATLGFADLLVDQGDEEEARIGRSLRGSLQGLQQAQSFDQIVDAMDDITADLDEFVDDCDLAADDGGTEIPGSVAEAAGAARVLWEQPENPDLLELATALRDSGIFEEVATDVTSTIALPRELPIVFTTCGEPNAAYDPGAGRVIMCYELLALTGSLLDGPEVSAEELGEAVLGSGVFFLLHELGHALVHQLDLPVTGREEDSVDGLATVILAHAGSGGAALHAVDHFASMARWSAEAGEKTAFWDEHSLDEQRVYDIACLVYGSNPEAYAGLAAPDYLPPERAARCEAEFEQKTRAWDQLLGPYFIGD